MNLITDISQHQKQGAVATIGFFDGVHLGHRYLLQQVTTEAARRGLRSMAITFAHHPRHTLCSDYKPRLITTLDEKIEQLESTGLDD
jgi:riboflavin kinase/FMN adenylyltransferase